MHPLLRKTQTLWLDERDSTDALDQFQDLSETTESPSQVKLEVLIGTLSKDSVSGPGEKQQNSATEVSDKKRCHAQVCSVKERHTIVYERQRKSERTLQESLEEIPPLPPPQAQPQISYSDVGGARRIPNWSLLATRLIILSALGILAGLSFSLRNTIPLRNLLSELFVWLHVLHFVIIPLLIIASLLIGSTLPDDYMDRDFSDSEDLPPLANGTLWASINAISHTIRVLSQAEIVRLLVLHFFPTLQPFEPRQASTGVFSLSSVFSFQRYVMAVFSLTEVVFSTAPERLSHSACVLFLSCCWEVYVFRLRAIDKPIGTRVGLVLMGITVAVSLSIVNVAIGRYMSAQTSASFHPKNGFQGTKESA